MSCRLTAAALPELAGTRLQEAVAQGFHGTMDWMEETLERRRDPRAHVAAGAIGDHASA